MWQSFSFHYWFIWQFSLTSPFLRPETGLSITVLYKKNAPNQPVICKDPEYLKKTCRKALSLGIRFVFKSTKIKKKYCCCFLFWGQWTEVINRLFRAILILHHQLRMGGGSWLKFNKATNKRIQFSIIMFLHSCHFPNFWDLPKLETPQSV